MGRCKPLIGVVHLPPLPGSPGYRKLRYPSSNGKLWSFEEIVDFAVNQSSIYREAGFDAVILENYGDKPYSPRVDKGQVAAMATIARVVAKEVDIIVGVNLLRNSGYESVYAAYISGASLVRINNLCEVRVSPEGLLAPVARQVARALQELDAYSMAYNGKLNIIADTDVKHSAPLTGVPLKEAARECVQRSGIPLAGIVVTGKRTGEEPSYEIIEQVAAIAEDLGTGLIIGSGVSAVNIARYWRDADGFIVGTSVKIGEKTDNPVDERKASHLAKLVKHYRTTMGC